MERQWIAGVFAKSILSLFLALSIIPSTAVATVITYEFSGVLTGMYEADYLGDNADPRYQLRHVNSSAFYSSNIFFVGEAFSGVFSYDTDAFMSPIIGDGAQANYLDGIVGASLRIGEYQSPSAALPRAGDGSLAIVNNRASLGPVDLFQFTQAFSSQDWFSTFTLSLQDRTATVFNDFTIPTSLTLDSFSAQLFQLAFLDKNTGNQLQITGRVDSLNAAVSVPEPNSFVLLLVGIIGVVLVRQKSQAS